MKLSPTFGNNIYLEEGTNRILNQQYSIGDTYSGGTIFYTEFNKIYVYRLATLSGDTTWKMEMVSMILPETSPDWGSGENNTEIIKTASDNWHLSQQPGYPIDTSPLEITYLLRHPDYYGWWIPSKDEAFAIVSNMYDINNPNMDSSLDIFYTNNICMTSTQQSIDFDTSYMYVLGLSFYPEGQINARVQQPGPKFTVIKSFLI